MKTRRTARAASVVATAAVLAVVPVACGGDSTQDGGRTNPVFAEGEPLSEEVAPPSPDEAVGAAVESFWRSLAAGDETATCEALTPEMRAKTPWLTGQTGECPAQMRRLYKQLNEDDIAALAAIKVTKVTIMESGTKATVEDQDTSVGEGGEDLGSGGRSMVLELVDRRWLIDTIG